MICAPANVDPCIPMDNLSTVHKHYGTYINLCSTVRSTWEACCNLSTAADLQSKVLIRDKYTNAYMAFN